MTLDQEFRYDVFLSHASEDTSWCDRLVERLCDEGLRVWYDQLEVLPGHNITDRINEGLETSRKVVAVWSKSYFKDTKTWTLAEAYASHTSDVLGRERPLIPVLIEDCRIKPTLSALVYIDFRSASDFDGPLRKLLRALEPPPPSAGLGAQSAPPHGPTDQPSVAKGAPEPGPSSSNTRATRPPSYDTVRNLLEAALRKQCPGATFTISNNQIIKGTSGCDHSVDLVAEINLADLSILIVVQYNKGECAVGVRDVLAFKGCIADVRAHKGVLVSMAGFDKDAVSLAETEHIGLLTMTPAQMPTWEVILPALFPLALFAADRAQAASENETFFTPMRQVAHLIFGGDGAFQRQNLAFILTLQRWLGIPGKPCFQIPNRARFALSQSSRAEARLFGVSDQPLCLRLYLDDSHSSFVNLRLSARFKNSIIQQGGWLAERTTDPARRIEGVEDPNPDLPVEPPDILGDSVLAVPARFKARYRIVADEFHTGYGDACTSSHEGPCLATPFIQLPWISGSCSHAVVFMATMLLQRHAASVHSPIEIAELLRNPQKDEFLIAGLSPRHITRYFSDPSVGLRAFHQSSPSPSAMAGLTETLSGTPPPDADQCFQNALRAHLLSGMPVIKSVDLGRLHGYGLERAESIYRRNKVGFEVQVPPLSPAHHPVLLLGCTTSASEQFLIHDPGGMPYLEASCSQLMDASSYSDESTLDNPSPALRRFDFQAVTPGRVIMPLHTHTVENAGMFNQNHGLYYIAACVYATVPAGTHPKLNYPKPEEYLRGEFRLVQADHLLEVISEGSWSSAQAGPLSEKLETDLYEIQKALVDNDGHHWFWVQRFARSCWIWDAEQAPPQTTDYSLPDLGKYLVAVASEDEPPSLYVSAAQGPVKTAQIAEGARERPRDHCSSLELVLNTNFSSQGIRGALEIWPRRVNAAQLSAFSQNDVADFLTPGRPELSPVEAMALLSDDKLEIERIASQIADTFGRKNIQIRTFAACCPDLVNRDPARRDLAKRALAFLSFLAEAMRTRGHGVGLIEVVSGSPIEGVLPVQYKGQVSMLATLKRPGLIFAELLDELRDVSHILAKTGVRLAIDSEPWPLSASGTEAAMDAFAAQIAVMEYSGDLPQGALGLNLDIGLWMRCRIDPTKLRDPELAAKVFSARISDRPKFHAGDCVPGSFHQTSELACWIRELKGLPNGSFSGSISVSLECAKNRNLLQQALDAAVTICAPQQSDT